MDTRTVIKRLGGGAKVAALCEITPAAVSQWINNGIPPARLMFLKLAKPDAFSPSSELPSEERPSDRTM
jgi:predicted transcriptional regulator